MVDSQSTTFLTVDSAIEINNIIKKIYIYMDKDLIEDNSDQIIDP